MRRFVWTAATLAVVALMPGCNRKMKISHLPYPDTRRDTTVVDDYHGTCVADPYRWLEDDNSAETAAWVEAENAVTRDYLDRLPARQAIYDRLTALYDYPKEGAPERHGDYYYYFLNDGLQNQSALWRKRSLTAQGELFLDPNTLSADGTTALVDVSFSDDGRWCAYAAAEAGCKLYNLLGQPCVKMIQKCRHHTFRTVQTLLEAFLCILLHKLRSCQFSVFLHLKNLLKIPKNPITHFSHHTTSTEKKKEIVQFVINLL